MDFPPIASQLLDRRIYPAILATLVSVDGSSYRRAGARLLIAADGCRWGSISGGCLEADLISRAQIMLRANKSNELVSYDTTNDNDLLWGVGTGCHGVVHILLETLPAEPDWLSTLLRAQQQRQALTMLTHWKTSPDTPHQPLGTQIAPDSPDNRAADGGTFFQEVLPAWHLVIFGAGDDAQPLVALAATLGWETSVVDPRPAMARSTRFPTAQQVLCLPAEAAAAHLTWDDRTVAVIMTHHYRYDLPLLQTIVPLHLPFLGLLGPRERGIRLLKDAGFGDSSEDKLVRNPVGLDLGGDGAAAVALSIVAEIQATIHGRDGRPLFERTSSIHHE